MSVKCGSSFGCYAWDRHISKEKAFLNIVFFSNKTRDYPKSLEISNTDKTFCPYTSVFLQIRAESYGER